MSAFCRQAIFASHLVDLVFFYNGEQLDWDVELAIPAGGFRADPLRNIRAAWLDDLDGTELDIDR